MTFERREGYDAPARMQTGTSPHSPSVFPDVSTPKRHGTSGVACSTGCELDRRSLLFGTGSAVVSVLIPGLGATAIAAQKADYPRRPIAKLTALNKVGSLTFRYPWDHPHCDCVLLQLAETSGGGIGPDKNVVAFHTLCTHMGAAIPLRSFHGKLGIAGPCPLHLTTFDLTKHGMVVSGHATQGLPQVLLELEGDDIVATGVLGLLYGLSDNRISLV